MMRPLVYVLFLALVASQVPAAPVIRHDDHAAPRVLYGAERLQRVLAAVAPSTSTPVIVGTTADALVRDLVAHDLLLLKPGEPRAKEGFVIASTTDGRVAVVGADDSGALYGCLELARRTQQAGAMVSMPLHVADAPAFVLRGPCIGMQKTYILPGRKVYEYPYTPELFPFFYDQAFWEEYLDFLADQRMNTLYLWNGHPFASLVRLPEYPEAVEVPDAVFQRNVEMFRWIARECDRRGIWLVQQFYSIIVSKPFAAKHGMSTQLRAPNALAADYTRKSIAEFVHQYPNIGLMPCLGEALQDQNAQTHWLTDVILPGVKDGMAAAGLTHEPPVVLRTHATDATIVMPAALKVYHNLYTETKYNGESLTTWEPRGMWQEFHQKMSHLGSGHIANVHILANLEPFRYGATDFIRKSVLAMRDRLGARGLHLYPLFYWNWPDSPDLTSPRLKQWHRDWIWFEAWGRYAWNPDIDEASDHAYWQGRLAEHYGAGAAADILAAYNDAGECAPRLLRRYGITEGNRQTLSLGMTLDELVHPEKYHEYAELWESQAPPGERLNVFAAREWKHEPHVGETPPLVNAAVEAFSARAVAEIDAAAPRVTRERAEFARLQNDVHCIREMTLNYIAKTNAAMAVLRYGYTHDVHDMVRAEAFLADSLEHYRLLAALTKDTYSAANSMQTSQRRIPVPGGVGGKPANYHWTQLLPLYEKELVDFRAQVAALKTPGGAKARTHAPLPTAQFKVLTSGLESYTVQIGNTAFTDAPAAFTSIAPELEGLAGIKFSLADAKANRLPPISFETKTAVRVLVGYFNARGAEWRKPPTLETDANAAEHGGAEPFIVNAVTIDGLPDVTVYAFDYGAGQHTLELPGTGAYIILGVAMP